MSIMETYGTPIKAALAILAFAGLCLLGKSWLEQREDRIRLDEELKATKQLIADREKRIEEINDTMQARDKELKETLKKVEELKARPATIREIVREIPQYIPLESPPTLTPDATAPEAPLGIWFNEPSAQGLRQFYLDCHAKTLKLQPCADNADDWKRKELTWAEKEKILEQQRDAAIRAVKGGTKWQRFKKSAKTFGVGVAIGVGFGVAASR